MKNILKYLTIAGVLILFLPFLKCSGEIAQRDDSSINTANIDTITEHDKLNNYDNNGLTHTNNIDSLNTSNSYSDKIQDFKYGIFVQDDSLTGIGLAFSSLIFLSSCSMDIVSIALLFLLLIVINSIILVILSFKKKIKLLSILAISNVVLLTISFALLETHFNQIKYGSYLFIINSILIIYLAIKNKRNLTI